MQETNIWIASQNPCARPSLRAVNQDVVTRALRDCRKQLILKSEKCPDFALARKPFHVEPMAGNISCPDYRLFQPFKFAQIIRRKTGSVQHFGPELVIRCRLSAGTSLLTPGYSPKAMEFTKCTSHAARMEQTFNHGRTTATGSRNVNLAHCLPS